jgi:hypothetical protein
MPTISISISGSTAVSIAQDHPITDGDLTKVVQWARVTYPSTATPDTRTDAQVMSQWAQSFIDGTEQATNKLARDAAAQAAADGQAGIDIIAEA